jgi:hypothetical protein
MRRALPAALAAALAAAGCGGGSLSTPQLRSDATRVCSLADRQTGGIPTPRSPADGAAFLKRGIAVLRPELVRLRGLRPPVEAADVYDTSLTMFARKVTTLDATVHELGAGADPVAAFHSLQRRLAPIEVQENDAWRALEIPACMNR